MVEQYIMLLLVLAVCVYISIKVGQIKGKHKVVFPEPVEDPIVMADYRHHPVFTVRLANIGKGSRLYKLGFRNGRFAKIVKCKKRILVRACNSVTYIPIVNNMPVKYKGHEWVTIHSHQYKVLNND